LLNRYYCSLALAFYRLFHQFSLPGCKTVTAKVLMKSPGVVSSSAHTADRGFQGRGLGGALLADALARAARAEIAAYALMVDAKDEVAATFYRHHGFIALPDSPLVLFLPRATLS
jgi:GNAT superfamily N-acetyltransferase